MRGLIVVMGIQDLIVLLQESFVLILIFSGLLAYALIRSRGALISLILGLYLALLISLKFPYYDALLNASVTEGIRDPLLLILLFIIFTALGAFLFERLIIDTTDEGAFECLLTKVLLALGGTILIMAFSYHVIPITILVELGTPASALFAPAEYFFWWLIVPLVVLWFV